MVSRETSVCSKCGGENLRRNQRYCHACHAAYMRENRHRYIEHTKKWPERARAYVKVKRAIGWGVLERKPCEVCGLKPAEGHHDDYTQPLVVRWLCKQCHADEHYGAAA